jgi:hypothetical protein
MNYPFLLHLPPLLVQYSLPCFTDYPALVFNLFSLFLPFPSPPSARPTAPACLRRISYLHERHVPDGVDGVKPTDMRFEVPTCTLLKSTQFSLLDPHEALPHTSRSWFTLSTQSATNHAKNKNLLSSNGWRVPVGGSMKLCSKHRRPNLYVPAPAFFPTPLTLPYPTLPYPTVPFNFPVSQEEAWNKNGKMMMNTQKGLHLHVRK